MRAAFDRTARGTGARVSFVAALLLGLSTCTKAHSASPTPSAVQDPAASSPLTTADLVEIDALRSAYASAEVAGDRSAQAALFTRDAALLEPGGPALEGRAAIRAAFDEFDVALDGLSLESQEVAGAGSLAYDRGVYRLEFHDLATRAAEQRSGRYLMVLRRTQGGAWRIAVLLHGPVVHDP